MKKDQNLIVGTKGELDSDQNLQEIFHSPFPLEKIEKRIEELSYFTPSIEDIRVGYECEANTYNLPFDGVKSWKSYKFQQQDFNVPIKHLPEYIRTPYLTKEQIQAEGWEEYETKMICKCFKKGDYHLFWFELNHSLQISKGTPPMWLNYYYNGKCPSINEFRIISKLLGI